MEKINYSAEIFNNIKSYIEEKEIIHFVDENKGELRFIMYNDHSVIRFVAFTLYFCDNNIIAEAEIPIYVDIKNDLMTYNVLKLIQMANCEFSIKEKKYYSPQIDSIDIGALNLRFSTGCLNYKTSFLRIPTAKAVGYLRMLMQYVDLIIDLYASSFLDVVVNGVTAEQAIKASKAAETYLRNSKYDSVDNDEKWYFSLLKAEDYELPEGESADDPDVQERLEIYKEIQQLNKGTNWMKRQFRGASINVFTSEI